MQKTLKTAVLALGSLVFGTVPATVLCAQAAPAALHTMAFTETTETIDTLGRIVVVGRLTGDLPGVVTMAFVVDASGAVRGGEFALNVSYTKYGPPDPDGDGDPSEVLIQLGTIKGSITGGAAGLARQAGGTQGMAINMNGVTLKILNASVQFASVTRGSGAFSGSNLTTPASSLGSLSLTF